MTEWNPSNPNIQEAEDFGNVPPKEAYGGNLDKAISHIPDLITKTERVIKKYHELHLSLLAEKIKKADRFYLARTKSKDIKPIMMEWIKVHKNAFDKFPGWYYPGQGAMNIENFWIDQRTIWNKAHGKKWNNNRDPDGRLMEYKRS